MEAFEIIKQNANAILESNEYGTTEEAYSRSMIDILEEYGEVENVSIGHYILENAKKNFWKLNAFCVNEELENYQLDLFIVDYTEEFNDDKLYTNDINQLKIQLKNFIKSAVNNKYENVQKHSIISQLCEDISSKKNKISKIDLYIISNKEIYNITKIDPFDELEKIDLNYKFWDIKKFESLIKSDTERSTINIDFNQFYGGEIKSIYINKSSKYSCILTVFPGKILSDLYRVYDTKLLESNVRVFLQQTGIVNQGIRDTIREKPEMFLTYNNGVSATCSSAIVENGVLLKVEDFQIVNGGQTTASLYYTNKKYDSNLDDVDVQVKITVISDQEIKDKEVPKISEYANTQNKVSKIDLNSNHPYLVAIEDLSRKVKFEDSNNHNLQINWFFERVNGAYREAKNKITSQSKKKTFSVINPTSFKFKKIDVARWINLFEGLPHIVSKGGQKSFMHLIDDHAREHILAVNKDYYMALIGRGIIFKWFDKVYGRHNTNPVGDTNVKSYAVNYTISLINLHIGRRINFIKIAKSQKINEQLYDDSRKLLEHTYKYLVRKSNGGLISELSKKKETWDDFKHINPPILIADMFNDYIDHEISNIDNSEKALEYILKLNSLCLKGTVIWDALNIFIKPEHSNNEISIHEKQIIEKGYNYFFRLKGTISFSFLETINNLLDIIDQKYNLDEIIKLSNRVTKKFPDLLEMHNKLIQMSQDELLHLMNSKKIQKSKSKSKYEKAIKAITLNNLNYNELTLDNLRYLGWALGF